MSAGSNPVTVSIIASVAQLVERRSEEPGVASSTLAGGTIPFRLMGRTSVFDSDNGSSSLPTGTTKNYERNDYYEQKISKHTKNMEDRTSVCSRLAVRSKQGTVQAYGLSRIF